MSDEGLLLDFLKKLKEGTNQEKNNVLKTYLGYALGYKPQSNDYSMMFKLVKDFGHEILFFSLVDYSYSNISKKGNPWGYVVGICKNRLKDSVEYTGEVDYKITQELIEELKQAATKIDADARQRILDG